jgi:GNAT superfamily N-acetyltransferase
MWFAVNDTEHVVGSVVLGQSGRQDEHATVGWLMVAPKFRRCGIGRLLLATLEAAAWSLKKRELTLETHADWTVAVRFYERCGYVR